MIKKSKTKKNREAFMKKQGKLNANKKPSSFYSRRARMARLIDTYEQFERERPAPDMDISSAIKQIYGKK